jgi:hypothetical protein
MDIEGLCDLFWISPRILDNVQADKTIHDLNFLIIRPESKNKD